MYYLYKRYSILTVSQILQLFLLFYFKNKSFIVLRKKCDTRDKFLILIHNFFSKLLIFFKYVKFYYFLHNSLVSFYIYIQKNIKIK